MSLCTISQLGPTAQKIKSKILAMPCKTMTILLLTFPNSSCSKHLLHMSRISVPRICYILLSTPSLWASCFSAQGMFPLPSFLHGFLLLNFSLTLEKHMSGQFHEKCLTFLPREDWLAHLVEHETLDLGAGSLCPMWSVEITQIS